MRFALIVGCGIAAVSLSSANAGVFTDDLSRCLIAKATDGDRSAFIAWMFSAISSDPELQKLTSLDRAKRDQIGGATAKAFERLLLEDCRKEAVAAIKTEGENAISQSFGALGQSASAQMFRSPEAQAELESLGTKFDDEKLKALGREAGLPEEKPKQ